MNNVVRGTNRLKYFLLIFTVVVIFSLLLTMAYFIYQNTLEIKRSAEITEKINNSIIQKDEFDPFLTAIVLINCKESWGSGILWDDDGTYGVLTNSHVIEGDDCTVVVDDQTAKGGSLIYKNVVTSNPWNKDSDSAFLQLTPNINSNDRDTNGYTPVAERRNFPVSNLNYLVSKTTLCKNAEIGMPVIVIGYPSATTEYEIYGNDFEFPLPSRTITNGIISSLSTTEGTIIKDFYVTAKIDAGNSGGVAFSKENGQLCLLGIPSWVNVGTYDVHGIVQNIYYILQNKIREELPKLPKIN